VKPLSVLKCTSISRARTCEIVVDIEVLKKLQGSRVIEDEIARRFHGVEMLVCVLRSVART
jgi:hypothetical protein